MYGLPIDTDVSFLRGALLTQVCVGQNELILNLYPESPYSQPVSIMFTAFARLVGPDVEELIAEESLQIAPALLQLLGSTVSSVSILPPGTLRLIWTSGHVLDVIDSEEHYESYTITNGNRVIVV